MNCPYCNKETNGFDCEDQDHRLSKDSNYLNIKSLEIYILKSFVNNTYNVSNYNLLKLDIDLCRNTNYFEYDNCQIAIEKMDQQLSALLELNIG